MAHMGRVRYRSATTLAAMLAALLAACAAPAGPAASVAPSADGPGASSSAATSGSGPTLTASWEQVDGEVVVGVEVTGIEVRFVQGDVSGATGHLHLFVDREPVGPGDQIGFEEGIIHTVNRQVAVPGLEPGEHVIWVVVADGRDTALDPPLMTRLDVTLE